MQERDTRGIDLSLEPLDDFVVIQPSDEESETLLRGFLSPQLFERGLICRADDRGAFAGETAEAPQRHLDVARAELD